VICLREKEKKKEKKNFSSLAQLSLARANSYFFMVLLIKDRRLVKM